MSAGAETVDILCRNLEQAPIQLDPIERIHWENLDSFMFQGTGFVILERLSPLPDAYPDETCGLMTFRYLALNTLTGANVCLTTTPRDFHADDSGLRRAEDIEDDLVQFCSEPINLIKLARAEQAAGTHYFPRLLSPVLDTGQQHYAYLTEYVPGVSIADLPIEAALNYREEFRRAMAIAHWAGVRFHDLGSEDLRVLPDGSIMMLDFNMTTPRDGRPIPYAADFEKLDLMLDYDLQSTS